jgi:hypothetical protein
MLCCEAALIFLLKCLVFRSHVHLPVGFSAVIDGVAGMDSGRRARETYDDSVRKKLSFFRDSIVSVIVNVIARWRQIETIRWRTAVILLVKEQWFHQPEKRFETQTRRGKQATNTS